MKQNSAITLVLGMVIVVTLIIIILALQGPRSGRVVEKSFDPAHQELNITIEWDQFRNLSTNSRVVQLPDRWTVTVSPDGTSLWKWAVSEKQYKAAIVGKEFSR